MYKGIIETIPEGISYQEEKRALDKKMFYDELMKENPTFNMLDDLINKNINEVLNKTSKR